MSTNDLSALSVNAIVNKLYSEEISNPVFIWKTLEIIINPNYL